MKDNLNLNRLIERYWAGRRMLFDLLERIDNGEPADIRAEIEYIIRRTNITWKGDKNSDNS
jgi:hypothetical protein